MDWGINFYNVEVGWSCMGTTSSFWAEVVATRLARLSFTPKSWISLKIHCEGCESVDSKCMNGLCFNPSGYGVFHLCKRWICCYQWRRKNVLKLQLCFCESSDVWRGQHLDWSLLVSDSCCLSAVFSLLLVSLMLNEILMCLDFCLQSGGRKLHSSLFLNEAVMDFGGSVLALQEV